MSNQTQEIVKKTLQMPWQPWLLRRYDPLVTYLVMRGGLREVFLKEGIEGEFPLALFDTETWYSTEEMFRLGMESASKYLLQKDIIAITEQCENRLSGGVAQITDILNTPRDPKEDFKKVIEIIEPLNVYVWIAHASEVYYHKIARETCTPFCSSEELETFIGDISLPLKKNALGQMEAEILTGASAEYLHKKYAWIKARGGFQPGYTLEEVVELQATVLNKNEQERAPERIIPPPLSKLAKELQALVYLRTLRTDALWELYHLAQPIFNRAAQAFGVASVKDYLPNKLLSGEAKKIESYAIVKYFDEIIVTDPIIKPADNQSATQVSGVVAFRGNVSGKVKIIYSPQDAKRIQNGDILVTNMTIPAYISAMHRASAFVTDEGGITCHAAIIARELKKPCITGTKNATKVFKDDDRVEVDAEKGIVRKIP